MIRQIALGVMVAAIIGVWFHGRNYERDLIEEETAKEAAKVKEQDRLTQEAVNNAIYQQFQDYARINDTLSADLERVRNQKRVRESNETRFTCAGANGFELATEHAEFLTRYSALAAKQDAALKTCYAAYDAIP